MRNVQSISVTIPSQMIQSLDRIQRDEEKSCSSIVTEALRQYLELNEYRTLQRQLSTSARVRKIITEEDIDKIVHGNRNGRNKNSR